MTKQCAEFHLKIFLSDRDNERKLNPKWLNDGMIERGNTICPCHFKVWTDGLTDNKRPMWATVAHLSTMNASKIWHQNGTKNNKASSHMLQDHCYAVAFWAKNDFFLDGDPCDLFLPCHGSAPGQICPKHLNAYTTISTSSLPSFINIHHAVLISKGWICVPRHIHELVHPPLTSPK